jgi:hypothetical protein
MRGGRSDAIARVSAQPYRDERDPARFARSLFLRPLRIHRVLCAKNL